jgi:predicted nucleic acid-binding protein
MVICDSSSLIHLSAIGRLGLLKDFHGALTIPQAVWQEVVLLDETEARKIAELFGLKKTGAIGILIRAKLEGKIQDLRLELDRLRTDGGFWIEEGLFKAVLQSVGE